MRREGNKTYLEDGDIFPGRKRKYLAEIECDTRDKLRISGDTFLIDKLLSNPKIISVIKEVKE